jgi:hypothetical protein
MTRRFVPFGRDWRMGIEVPYSLAVLDHGCLWSCGQCPLDRDARVLFPGKLRNQLELIAGRIGDELARLAALRPTGSPSSWPMRQRTQRRRWMPSSPCCGSRSRRCRWCLPSAFLNSIILA